MNITWKHFAPIVVAIVIALIPAPAGLPQYAWYYFAIFAGVIVGLMLEPLPGGAIGLIGVTFVARLSEYVFYSPEQLAKPGFNPDNASLSWALSGFSNSHGVADFRRVHVCSRLRKDRSRPAHRADAGKSDGAKDADSRLCGGDCRYDSCAVYSFEHRAQRRDDLSGD